MSEAQISRAIQDALALAGAPVWRNNTGGLDAANGRWVTYGLGLGGADLIGCCPVEIETTIAGVTRTVRLGRFFALEVKSATGRVTPEQVSWSRAVRARGGFCAVVRSVDEALAALARCRSWDVE